MTAYDNQYYSEHPERKLAVRISAQKSRDRNRNFIRELKNNPCVDCGKKYHFSVMQFDHIIGIKKFDISKAVVNCCSISRILKEVSKCQLVCANCHAFRTYNRSRKNITGDVLAL